MKRFLVIPKARVLVGAGLVCSSPSFAQEISRGATKQAQTWSVSLSVVSDEIGAKDIAAAIGESPSFDFRYEELKWFSPEDWYHTSQTNGADIRVWVVIARPSATTIYFADPEADRFMIRHLRLSDQLDEMDRESLAQAIMWSLQALAHGTVGALTRDQAHVLVRELAGDDGKSLASGAQGDKREGSGDQELWQAARKKEDRSPFGVEVQGGYRISAHSSQIPLVHGPYLRVGLDRRGARNWIGVGALGSYVLPREYQQGELALRLNALYLRGELRAFFTQGKWGWGPFLGGGAEISWLDPSADSEVWDLGGKVEQASTFVSAGFTSQFRFNHWSRLELSAEVDIDLLAIEYEVIEEGTTRTFIQRGRVRPALRMGFSFF